MPASIPTATYRLQFSNTFGFRDAAELVPYLKQLGISHIYASPFLRAREGSTHGYDVVDHNRVDPQFGGQAAFDRFRTTLTQADMGLILDFVPNHMGIGRTDNAWWLDILEWGPASPYAHFFDIDWKNAPGRRRPAVTLPILGKSYGQALSDGELKLAYEAETGSFAIWYFEHRLPIRLADYPDLLTDISGISELADPGMLSKRQEAEQLKTKLAAAPHLAAEIERALSRYNGSDEVSRRRLNRLLTRQHYALAYWRSSGSEINYRRFFDINDLAGLRMEDPEVFAATHKLVGELIREGGLHGIRLDHVDGLYDPAGYCRMLGEYAAKAGAPDDFYILIEKILGEDEALPTFPYVAGTTGYEWMNVIARLFVQEEGSAALEIIWRDFSGQRETYEAMEQAAKAEVISSMFAGELATLIRLLRRISAGNARSQDFTAEQLRTALLAYVQALPVYRTYVAPSESTSKQDRAIIDAAVVAARKAAPRIEPALFEWLRDLLTLDLLASGSGYSRRRVGLFIGKLQQFTGPVMAKSLEDTCFYRYFRLIALNEVGGHPHAGGLSAGEFHNAMGQRLEQQPNGLTATATHDTKRGEDARLRLAALSEVSDNWKAAVSRWHDWNGHLVADLAGRAAPSKDHEYFLYQALLGAWPLNQDPHFADRAVGYAIKAMREGKQETSWHYPDEAYEKAVETFLRGILDARKSPGFHSDFASFADRLARLGAMNALSQVAIKLTMPGVPDIYQGTELWDLSFVDPDNRRSVDYALRQQLSNDIGAGPDWLALTAQWQDGRVKFALLQTLLRLRREYPEVFKSGDYRPLKVTGSHARSAITFSRRLGDRVIVVAAGRLMGTLSSEGREWVSGPAWKDTALELPPDRSFSDRINNPGKAYRQELPLSEGFAQVPVAVLVAE